MRRVLLWKPSRLRYDSDLTPYGGHLGSLLQLPSDRIHSERSHCWMLLLKPDFVSGATKRTFLIRVP